MAASPLAGSMPMILDKICSKGTRIIPRPFCAAFKPVALLNAMISSDAGDYVMWMDCSKYFDYSRETESSMNISGALKSLEASSSPSGAYGTIGCATDCNQKCRTLSGTMTKPTGHNRLSDQTRDGFAAIALEAGPLSDDTYEHFPMVRNSNMIFRVDKNNVAILEAWRDMARANPAAFWGAV